VIAVLLILAAPEPTLMERAKAAVERLWKAEVPEVAAANEKVRRGEAPQALELYDRAEKKLTAPRDAAALAYDRSAAFLASGKEGAASGGEEAKRALEGQAPELHGRAAYNLGFALSEQGKREEAIAAYGKSLQLEPSDGDAKYNLELLLREEKKQQQGGSGQQKQEDKPPQKGQEKNEPAQAKGDPQKKDDKGEAKDALKPKEAPQAQEGQQQKPDKGEAEDKQQAQGAPPPKKEKDAGKEQQAQQGKPVDRSEAQRLLDALRATEKNLQVWRFGQRQKQPPRRRDAVKDW